MTITSASRAKARYRSHIGHDHADTANAQRICNLEYDQAVAHLEGRLLATMQVRDMAVRQMDALLTEYQAVTGEWFDRDRQNDAMVRQAERVERTR